VFLPQHRNMAQDIPEARSPQAGDPEPNNGCDDPYETCRGRGWLVTMRRVEATAGVAAQTELLAQAQADCLMCSGTGQREAS
jgi:hypothetical protein